MTRRERTYILLFFVVAGALVAQFCHNELAREIGHDAWIVLIALLDPRDRNSTPPAEKFQSTRNEMP